MVVSVALPVLQESSAPPSPMRSGSSRPTLSFSPRSCSSEARSRIASAAGGLLDRHADLRRGIARLRAGPRRPLDHRRPRRPGNGRGASHSFEPRDARRRLSAAERGRAVGTWSAMTSITAALGPPSEDGSSRRCHGGPCSWSTSRSPGPCSGSRCARSPRPAILRRPDRSGRRRSRDGGLGALVYGLIEAPRSARRIPAPGAPAAAASPCWPLRRRRAPDPPADGSARPVSQPDLRGREPADALSLCRALGRVLLSSLRSDPGARLHARRAPALPSCRWSS